MNPSHPQYDGKPIEWVRVHKAPDYVYFNHSAHLNRGISCQSCHGNVDQMEVVYQAQPHSMGWCLECHRNPEKFLRPLEEVFNFQYDAKAYLASNPLPGVKTTEDLGAKLKEQFKIQPKTSCATCHH
jgi:Cytochrome c7 and related cytochrome c